MTTQRRRVAPLNRKTKTVINKNIVRVGQCDFTLLWAILILLLIGVIMVFSSSYYTTSTSPEFNYDPFFFLKKQTLMAIAGIFMMTIMMHVNYRVWKVFALPAYIVSLILLIALFFVGVESHGATRWLVIGPISIQPSEIMKISMILFLARVISDNPKLLNNLVGFIFCCGIVGLATLLIMVGNLSTAIIVACVGMGIIFIASPHIWRFVAIGALGVVTMLVYLLFGSSFRSDRFAAWMNPFDYASTYGFQTIQSLYAISSGGFFGLGLGNSRQKTYVPEAHNDIIFAIICEELGFFGAFIVILLYGILIWRGIKIAIEAPDVFGSLVAAGITMLIGVQVIINIGVVTNTIPNTGIPLPYISSGGTALIITMAMSGILLNISCFKRDEV